MVQSTMKAQRIEISSKTIIFTVLFVLGLQLLWQIRTILLLFFLCFIFMEVLNPCVSWLEKRKLSRPLAILILYLLILLLISFALAGIVPVLVEQTTGLINILPRFLQQTQFWGVPAINWSAQFKILQNLPGHITQVLVSLFSNVFFSLVVFIITFYLLLERKNFKKYSFYIFGPSGHQKALQIINNLEKRLGSWFNAEIFLMTAIGLASYLGFWALGLRFAVPLAIIAGLLEVVPNIGPIVSTTLAVIVALSLSPLKALLTLIFGILLQQAENNLLVPRVMKKTVGLNPLLTILLLLTGAKLASVAGAVLAIPVYLTIDSVVRVLFPHLYSSKNTQRQR